MWLRPALVFTFLLISLAAGSASARPPAEKEGGGRAGPTIASLRTEARRACRRHRPRRCKVLNRCLKRLKAEKANKARTVSSTRPRRQRARGILPAPASTTSVGPETAHVQETPEFAAPAIDAPAPTTSVGREAAGPEITPPVTETVINGPPPVPGAVDDAQVGPSPVAASTSWRPLNEPGSGGRITALSISPFDAKRVLVGGDMLGVGLSTDGGESWQATTGFSSWEINDFTWDPADPEVVWVGTMSGPYRSSDGGRTWTAKRSGLPTGDYPYSAPIQKVLIDPANPRHMLAFGGSHREMFAPRSGALNYGVIFESWDAGSTWAGVGSLGVDANILDVAAVGLETIYAATRSAGVQRSEDGGRTWTTCVSGLPSNGVSGLAVDPGNPKLLWAAVKRSSTPTDGVYSPGRIYRSVDGCRSWSTASKGLTQYTSPDASQTTSFVSVHRAPDGVLYTADHGYRSQKRFKSNDGGLTWTEISSSVPRFYPAATTPYVWASSADGELILGGTSDAVLRTSDQGATWDVSGAERVSMNGWRGTGFSGLVATRVSYVSEQPGLMFLNAFDAGGVLRSEDGGASWSRPLASWDNYGGAYDLAARGAHVYSVLGQEGAFNGIARSSDAGKTWMVSAGGALPARRARGSERGSVAITSEDGRSAVAVLPDGQLYETADAGGTWGTTGVVGARAVAVSDDLKTVYIGTDSGVLLRPTASGAAALVPASPVGLRRLVVANGVVWGTGPIAGSSSAGGLWRFRAGAWERVFTNRFVSDVAVDPADSERVIVTTDDDPYHGTSSATGVWLSKDGGNSFSQFNEGLAMTRITTVTFNPWRAGIVTLGTNGRGFWSRRLSRP